MVIGIFKQVHKFEKLTVRQGEILKYQLGCEFLYTFWDILYTGVFGYAESNSQVAFLILKSNILEC